MANSAMLAPWPLFAAQRRTLRDAAGAIAGQRDFASRFPGARFNRARRSRPEASPARSWIPRLRFHPWSVQID